MNAARLFPFLNELRHYSLRDFRADFVAALTVTPMAVPQAMAYALIAGVHPQYGIYACMLPVIVAALWGSARYLAAGPTNAISMVLFTTMSTVSIGGITVASLPEEARMPYIFGIALLCGLIQVGMGLARLGELANFISHSVMVAFSAGAALLISCTIPAFFIKRGAWLQHRAHTLALWMMFTMAVPSFVTSSKFAVNASHNDAALMTVSAIALAANVAVALYQIYVIVRGRKNPLRDELYTDLEAYKSVREANI